MNNWQIGSQIRILRKEKGYTQKQLAELLHVSPKTVSKWETAAGCPDISIISRVAQVLGTSAEYLLQEDEPLQVQNGGNMKRIQFYCCDICGNILTSTGRTSISCCGRTLLPMKATPIDAHHAVQLEPLDDDYFVTISHPMDKAHYIRFIAWVSYDRMTLVRLYPEQNPELHINLPRRGSLYVCCSKDGLFQQKL